MKYHVILLAGLLMAVSCNCGVRKAPDTLPASAFGPASAEYLSGCSVYNDGADTLLYRYIEPLTLEKGKKYPLVLFLHGAGERGSDNELQLVHCSRVFTNPVNRLDFPCYAIFPQCPEKDFWAYQFRNSFTLDNMPADSPETDIMKAVLDLVDSFAEKYPVDTRRLYVMGLSMGGMATFDIIARHPDKFAAAVPICGAINPDRLTCDIKTHIRIYHGDADPAVPLFCSRVAYWKLLSCGVPVEYKEYPGVGHNAWNPAVSEPDFLPWMFSQKKK